MVLVDPKRVEMAIYENLPHLLTPPVTDAKKAVHVLAWAIREMEKRYTTFAKARVRNLEGFNEKVLPKDKLPHIVIVVDELADLMMTAPKEVEEYICRLAQMARPRLSTLSTRFCARPAAVRPCSPLQSSKSMASAS